MTKTLLQIFTLCCLSQIAFSANWSENAPIPIEGRPNPLSWTPSDLEDKSHAGLNHALAYPVTVTGTLVPHSLFEQLFTNKGNPIFKAARSVTGWHTFDHMESWMGLAPFPNEIPRPHQAVSTGRMGTSYIETENGIGVTWSCAACHTTQLFGKVVIGGPNKFPRANDFFLVGKKAMPLNWPSIAQAFKAMSPEEAAMMQKTKNSLRKVNTPAPKVLGLDTSLSQVALSLARRKKDDYASPSKFRELFPRNDFLTKHVADSKPGTWWTVKYKNRWLSDGSVVSGNPIYTNFLWNEIGRGTDLNELETWLKENNDIVEELSTFVFASEPPLYSDFFPVEDINIEKAIRGQKHFRKTCARCHGDYQKGWEDSSISESREMIKTHKVHYHTNTPVVDVGTDPGRYQGMKSLEQLNDLAISKSFGVLVKSQKGYVPPPLVGIWARWPYFHNNSAPSLCAVLSKASERPKTFIGVRPIDSKKDFDQACNGFPSEGKAAYVYDTSLEGQSNSGHDEGIFLRNGKELLSPEQKMELIEFLKTL